MRGPETTQHPLTTGQVVGEPVPKDGIIERLVFVILPKENGSRLHLIHSVVHSLKCYPGHHLPSKVAATSCKRDVTGSGVYTPSDTRMRM